MAWLCARRRTRTSRFAGREPLTNGDEFDRNLPHAMEKGSTGLYRSAMKKSRILKKPARQLCLACRPSPLNDGRRLCWLLRVTRQRTAASARQDYGLQARRSTQLDAILVRPGMLPRSALWRSSRLTASLGSASNSRVDVRACCLAWPTPGVMRASRREWPQSAPCPAPCPAP